MINSSRSTTVPTSSTIATRSEEQPSEPVQPELEANAAEADTVVDFDALQQENERLKKKLGDQGNSVGELRQQLAALQEQLSQPSTEPLQETDFYDDPEGAVNRAIDERVAPLQKQIVEERATQALSAIREAHGDYDDIIQSDGFRDWMGSSRYRQVMAREAEANLDAQAAIELVNMYKADTDITPEQAVQRDRELRASATETGRGYAGSGARFSWTQLRLLQARDPKQYKALLPQIMQAAQEGRVDP